MAEVTGGAALTGTGTLTTTGLQESLAGNTPLAGVGTLTTRGVVPKPLTSNGGAATITVSGAASSYVKESSPPSEPNSLYRNFDRVSVEMTRPWVYSGQIRNPRAAVVQYTQGVAGAPTVFEPEDTETEVAPPVVPPSAPAATLYRYQVDQNTAYGPPNGGSSPLQWLERWGPVGGDAVNFNFTSAYPNRPKRVQVTLHGGVVKWNAYRFNSSWSEWVRMTTETLVDNATTLMMVGYLSNADAKNFYFNKDWAFKIHGTQSAYFDGAENGFQAAAQGALHIPSKRPFVLTIRPNSGNTVVSIRRAYVRQQIAFTDPTTNCTDLMLAGTSNDAPEGSHALYIPEFLLFTGAMDDTDTQKWEETMVGKYQFGGVPE